MATKINKSKLKKNITNINKYLTDLANELKTLSEKLKTMMDGPYWNGGNAQKFYKKAVNNLKNDIADYKAAYNKLNAIAVKHEKLAKNDK